MMTTEQKQQFHRSGHLLVPSGLTKDEFGYRRAFVRPIFDPPASQRPGGDTSSVLFDVYRPSSGTAMVAISPTNFGYPEIPVAE